MMCKCGEMFLFVKMCYEDPVTITGPDDGQPSAWYLYNEQIIVINFWSVIIPTAPNLKVTTSQRFTLS
jgi:hypothetical protein